MLSPITVRDTVIILALTYGGVFLAALATPLNQIDASHDRNMRRVAVFFALIIFMTAGFTISACLARNNRWKHLFRVAVWVWLSLCLISLILMSLHYKQTIKSVMIEGFVEIICLTLGGALSYVFKKGDREPSA
jgi:hypothetical protein